MDIQRKRQYLTISEIQDEYLPMSKMLSRKLKDVRSVKLKVINS